MKVIYNSKIYLSRNKFCEALLIKDGRIIKTGVSKEILDLAPLNAEKIDAEGALVLPAFYDSHLHLMWTGRRAHGIECAGAASIEEIISRGMEYMKRYKPAAGTYIRGSGADPDQFKSEKRDIRREDLDKITKDHPLIISRHCGHIIYCNSAALELAGMNSSAPDIRPFGSCMAGNLLYRRSLDRQHVKGGTIERDENGRPTGVFRENASVLVQSRMPAPSKQEMKTHIRLAMQKAHSFGITACGSYDIDGPDFDNIVLAYREVYDELFTEGKPGLRVGMQCGISLSDKILDKHIKRFKDNPLWHDTQWGTFLYIQAIKFFADGTLGGHTAFLRDPYCDNPLTKGFPLMEQDVLDKFVKKADAAGMQILVHAIGDAGIDMVLNTFEKVTKPGSNPLRHGIVHCQITTQDLLERMARNKISALVQPGFYENDINILESRVGRKKASSSYAWSNMLKMGIPVNFSTDAPVSSLNPMHCIEWAVRKEVDIYDAADAYLSLITPGAFADLVFLDRDIFSIPAEDLQKAKILKTMCVGEIVHSIQ